MDVQCVLGEGAGTEDRGQKKAKMVQKVILRFRCYRPFRGKVCFFFYFCEIWRNRRNAVRSERNQHVISIRQITSGDSV